MGSDAGDRLLAEAEDDPEFKGFHGFKLAHSDSDGSEDSFDKQTKFEKKAKQIGDIMGQVRRNQSKRE